MDNLTDHLGSQGHSDHHGHADANHHHHTDDCCNHQEPHSIASLPDRLACEEMANAMTAMVLNDEKGISLTCIYGITSGIDFYFRANKNQQSIPAACIVQSK